MKKILTSITVVILLLVGVFFAHNYYNGPKITDGVVSKSIDENGKPVAITTDFSLGDTVYFSAKGNKFWIKKAKVVWYKDKIETVNRFLVEEGIDISKSGYFSTKLSVPEGLEEGHYAVSIYVEGKEIMETNAEFDVKR